MAIQTGQNADPADFINESERNATKANDAGKAVKLESDGYLSENWFTPFGYTVLGVTFNRFSALSDRVIHTNAAGTTSNQTNSGTYTKCAEIQVNEDMDLVRVRWSISRINTSGGTATFRNSAVFINGVQVSGDFSDDGTFSYDIATGLSTGDLVQIYVKKYSSTEDFLRVSNIQLCYDSQIEAFAGVTLDDPLLAPDPNPIDATNTL